MALQYMRTVIKGDLFQKHVLKKSFYSIRRVSTFVASHAVVLRGVVLPSCPQWGGG